MRSREIVTSLRTSTKERGQEMIHKIDHIIVKKRQLYNLLSQQTATIQAGSILDQKVKALGKQLNIDWTRGYNNIKASLLKELNAHSATKYSPTRK
jgi:hypothetical protein